MDGEQAIGGCEAVSTGEVEVDRDVLMKAWSKFGETIEYELRHSL